MEDSYGYDSRKNRTSNVTPNGSMTFNYNTENRLTSILAMNGTTYTYSRDNIGRLTNISGGGFSTTYTLSNVGSINTLAYAYNGSNLQQFSYTRNNSNYVTNLQDNASTTAYGLNSNDQITSASGGVSETFAYDELGNRVSDANGSFSYDSHKQRLQEDHSFIYAYDLNGNLTSKQKKGMVGYVKNFTYNSLNQLVHAEIFENSIKVKTVDYVYDVLGRRMQKEVIDHTLNVTTTRKYEYDGNEIIAVYNHNNNVLVKYSPSYLQTDDMLGMMVTSQGVSAGLAPSTGNYFFVKDGLGSIKEIRNSTGGVVQKITYSTFGKILQVKNAAGTDVTSNPPVQHHFAFTGREYEKELELYYYRARYYDQHSGRFLSKDPDPGLSSSPNTFLTSYGYAGGNPISYKDPSGQSFWGKFKAIAVGAIGGSLGALGAINFSGEFSSGEIRMANVFAIGILCAGTGGAAGGLVGGGWAGALAGGLAGGLVGGVAYDRMGYGTFRDGFIAGFISGAIAGYKAGSVVERKPSGNEFNEELDTFRDEFDYSDEQIRYDGEIDNGSVLPPTSVTPENQGQLMDRNYNIYQQKIDNLLRGW